MATGRSLDTGASLRQARLAFALGVLVAAGPQVAAAQCGDGVALAPEECDDGNAASGDGCSASCQLEDVGALCAGVASSSGTTLDAVLVASGLSQPVHIAAPPLDPNRLFIVEKTGAIRIVKNGALLPTPFLSLAGRVSSGAEQGLLSVAFHPLYEANRRLFVNYTDGRGNTVVARYTASAVNPDVVDPSSERILLIVNQPFPNHNGGQLAFGADGRLYVGMGDGGGNDDPFDQAQNDFSLLGKLLRLDVDVEVPPFYAVPPDNPNPGAGPLFGLIWAKGTRNPWRFSFDRLSGELYMGDVGQNQFEEIDVVPAPAAGGANFGWDVFEANACYEPLPLFADCPVPPTGFTFPVLEYDHGQGCAVTGGFVYRGCALPDLHGTYFYGDYCSAFVRSFALAGGIATALQDHTADLAPSGGLAINQISSFGEDARGELYIADQGGEVYKIVAGVAPTETPTFTFTPTPLPTDTPTATATATDTETWTPTETDTPTATDTPTFTATPTDTASPTPTITETPTATAVDTSTATATAVDTSTPLPTATDTAVAPTATETFIAVTPTGVVAPTTAKPTRTGTATRTATRTRTATPTFTATATPTPPPPPPGPCIGDVTGDGRVTAADALAVTRAMLSTPGRPRWNPAADINGNNIVDPIDLVIVLAQLLDPDCH
ncbi:MAG: PQQ-dependent sugar dehydrogenase [Deltaproteobacteria bacterium]|nr:PQQ-dependent sugar dehydrogenase [Deltaproteobacteria bacterium]